MQIPEVFNLRVFDENGLIYEQEVSAISAENDKGPLSILSGHVNFISTIKGSLTEEKLIVHLKTGEKKGFLLESGVIKAYNNKVDIFLVLDFNFDIENSIIK